MGPDGGGLNQVILRTTHSARQGGPRAGLLVSMGFDLWSAVF